MPEPDDSASRSTLRDRWRELLTRRDLAPLLAGMPSRGRVGVEIAWMVHALVGVPISGHLLITTTGADALEAWWRVGNAVLLAVVAVALVGPRRLWRDSRRVLAVLLPLAVVSLTGLVVVGPGGGQGARIGVAPADVPSAADPASSTAEVASIVPGTPAAGRLRVGDHILAINGEPLAGDSPAADLVARAQGPELPAGPATFTIERAGERVEVVLELPPPPTAGLLAGAFRVTLLRNAALLMLLAIFLWRDGQALDHLGLERERFWTETRFGLPALLFLVLGHFVVSVAVSIVGWALGGEVIEAEIGQRMAVTDALLAQLAWTAGIVLLGSATEEVIFRGFLLPRLRHATGSWVAAVAISVVAFGTAHLYEGALATVQTAAIGLMLSLVFLLRRHLMPCIVAHLGFNTLVLGLAYAFVRLGLFEWMQKILGS